MVKNNQKTGFYAVFGHFGAIWVTPSGPKKVLKELQVGKIYGPMFKYKNKLQQNL
jgi:hypothetical protein